MHLKYPLFLLLALTLAIQLAPAASPWTISELSARVTFSGNIRIGFTETGYQMTQLEGSFYIVPQPSIRQSIRLVSVSPQTYSIEEDKFGNQYIKFKWAKPSEATLSYMVVWEVNSSKLAYALIPQGTLGEAPPSNIQQYLTADNLTEWNGFIKAKAESLTEGTNSTLEAVRRLTSWVSSWVTYNVSYWKDSCPAKTVFLTRNGVCDEYTNLFISLCRSIGIPARYVEGLVFSGEKWNFHAWAEVYLNGWIPVDPTYDEVGFVDSSHIPLAHVHGDNDVYNRLKWEGSKLTVDFGTDDVKVEISNPSTTSFLDMRVKAKDELSGLEAMNVTVSLENLANSFVVATCSVNMPKEMLMLGPKESSIVIAPYGFGSISWDIASPATLDQNWLHRMPLEISCFPNAVFNKTLLVDPRSEKPPFPRVAITDLTISNESNAVITVKNEGTMELKDVVVSLCVSPNATCINETATFEPGEEKRVDISGFKFTEGVVVSAKLYSKEVEAATREITLRGLIAPNPFEFTPIKPLQPNMPNKGSVNEQLLILVVAVILVAVMLSVFVAVLTKHKTPNGPPRH